MKAQDLSIYQVTYKLLEKVARYSSGFPRNWKISLAARLQSECVEMVMDVYRANAARSGRAEIVGRILLPHRRYMRNRSAKAMKQAAASDERKEDPLAWWSRMNSYLGFSHHVNGYNLRKQIAIDTGAWFAPGLTSIKQPRLPA